MKKLFDAINESAKIIAAEKMIDQQIVFQALEEAMTRAAKSQFNIEHDVIVKINKENSNIVFYEVLNVVDERNVENPGHISLSHAKKYNDQAVVGGIINRPLPEIQFTRNLIQMVRNIITQRVKEAENIRQFEEYKNKQDQLIHGIIKRYENGNLIVDIGRAEAIMSRRDILPRENLNINDKVKAYIYGVKEHKNGPQIFISRTHPRFVLKLLEQEIPEITSGDILVMGIARDAGSKTKIAVKAVKENINPVGTCVGIRGSRINPVISELKGEKIDIVKWSDDLAMFIINALSPAEITKIVINEQSNQVDVIVAQKSLSMAIGSGGQNVRLSSQLTGKKLNIIDETKAQEIQKQTMQKVVDLLMNSLQIDEIIAQVLYLDGFNSPEEILQVDISELEQVQGINQQMAKDIQAQAKQFIQNQEQEIQKRLKSLNIDPKLLQLSDMTSEIAILLGEHGINNVQGLADMSRDDLISEEYGLLRNSNISAKKIDSLIMEARELLQTNHISKDQSSDAKKADSDEEAASKSDPNS